MTFPTLKWICSLALLALPAAPAAAQQEAPRPNIIVIMADDMGYSDIGSYGSEIDTPTLDKLAENGVRFTQAYNFARCCPTRAALLTGQYPHQVGLQRNGQTLDQSGATLAEALKPAGYNTAMVGKWHLTRAVEMEDKAEHLRWLNRQDHLDRPFGPIDTYPARRGFDRYYGVIWGVINFFNPFSLIDGVEPVKEVPDDYYATDAFNDKAAQYVREMAKEDKPFFLYLAHTAPHWPLHALPEDIRKYEDRYTEGWDKLREERYQRQLEMGLVNEEEFPLPPVMGFGPHSRGWENLSDEQRAIESRKMAVHAAMIDRMDQGLADVLAALEESGEMENTIIFFLSDNGASPESPARPGYDRPSALSDGTPIEYRDSDHIGDATSWAGIGSFWANAANTPFRYWKAESFEGGVHTPMIVHWPAGLKLEAGSLVSDPADVIDILPTCLELAGATYPKSNNGHSTTPVQGKSLAGLLRGTDWEGHDALYFEHEGGKAIRVGDWKLVQPRRGARWELYDLSTDRTETRNVAAEYPDRVEEMKAQWQSWADKVGVLGR